MNAKELRELLSNVPDETQILLSQDGQSFLPPCKSDSGLITFEGICDKEGNSLESDGLPDNFTVFALFSCNLECEASIPEPSLN